MNTFINALNQYALTLEQASCWSNSKEPIGFVQESKQDDFIYEFYSYLRILCDLKQNHKIEYIPGDGHNKNKFPKKPANKTGRPYFKLYDQTGRLLYQVCAGTKIKVKHGNKFDTPDISFQFPNAPADSPSYQDVHLIMDAKYSANGSVSKGSYNDFCMMIKNLDVHNATFHDLKFDNFIKINNNCLISNSAAYTDDLEYIKSHDLCELENLNEENKYYVISS